MAAAAIGAAFVAGPALALASPAGAATPTPSVTAGSATPTTGSANGGTAVTILGTNLGSTKDGSPTVLFGYVPVTPTVATNGDSMTATSPAEAPGPVTVTVNYVKAGKIKKSTNAGTFTYTASAGAPAVTGVSPASGPFAGGNTVTISGVNLGSATAIDFGSAAAGTPITDTATSITVAAPLAPASGAVAVSVTTANGTSTTGADGDVYTYGPNTGATGYLPPASLIIGSGSATTYTMMLGLANVFDEAPGCDLTNTKTNQVGLQCYNSATGYADSDVPESGNSTANDGESGLPVSSINPLNDYVANAPATGSGNGRTELTTNDPLTAGPDGLTAFNVSFGRSSSFKAVTGLNYVGYATDAVTWTAAAQVGGTATGHADVVNISKADLSAIWAGNLSCVIGGVTVTMDWRCLEKDAGVTVESSADPVDCYTTQTASGTYSTWSGYLGFTANPPACATTALEAGDANGTDPNAATDHSNLTENQWGSIATETSANGQTNDTANAIYFFSYGKFVANCTSNVTTANDGFGTASSNNGVQEASCAGAPSNDIFTIGAINGLIPDEHTIQGNGDGSFQSGQQFPDNRYLYNAYANSAAANPANAATLNFVGSTGWLCRDTTSLIDPNTGVNYRTEIENTIRANGFFPIDVNQTPFNQVDLNNVPANEVGAGTFYPNDTLTSNKGFCYNSGASVGGS